MNLNIIFELDSEIFLKNDILRILCATEYIAYFYIHISVNGYNIKAIINLGALKNFILFKIIIKIQTI